LNELPWQRITDDPEYRADFISAMFELLQQATPQKQTPSPANATYGTGCDGSEGNSGETREFDPTPWL
jgi:hypothetical protein